MERTLFKGSCISSGVGSGKIFIRPNSQNIPCYKIPISKLCDELDRLQNAINKICSQTRYFFNDLKASSTTKSIYESQKLLLKDPLLIGEVETILETKNYNIEWTLKLALDNFSSRFSQLKDPFFTEKFQDLKDIIFQLINILHHEASFSLPEFKEPTILVCEQLFISDVIQITNLNITGIIVEQIGPYSHSAILANARGIPVIGGINIPNKIFKTPTHAIINATEGLFILHPNKHDTEAILASRLSKNLISLYSEPLNCSLKSGQTIEFQLNIETIEQVSQFKNKLPIPIGLFRTEYLYLRHQGIPNLSTQADTYKKLGLHSKSTVTIRLFDFRADKHFLRDSGFPFISELQSLDFLFQHNCILMEQIEAIVLAHIETPMNILIPMVSRREEILLIRNALFKQLEKYNLTAEDGPKLGIMLELPGTIFIIDQLADLIDFISIGSNDLVHHALGVDRLAECSYPINKHLSLLRMLYIASQTCKDHNIPINVCGEVASDPEYIKYLVGMGISCFSVNPSKIQALKQSLTDASLLDCENSLNQLLFTSSIYK